MILLFKNVNKFYLSWLNFLSTFRQVYLIGLTIGLQIFITLIFSFFFFPNHSAGPKFDNTFDHFFLPVIVAPLVETFIFQYAIQDFILRKIKNAYFFACLISSTLFGLSHYYSPEYILVTFLSGILFSTLYLVSIKKNYIAFISVAIAHSIYNFIGFCVDYFAK